MTSTSKGRQTNEAGRRSHAANLQATAAGLPTVEDAARYLRAVEDLLAWAPLILALQKLATKPYISQQSHTAGQSLQENPFRGSSNACNRTER